MATLPLTTSTSTVDNALSNSPAPVAPAYPQSMIPTPTYIPVGKESIDKSTPNVSTTTISNANKINTVPTLNTKLDTLSDKGVRTDPKNNVATYADGSVYNEPTKDDLLGQLGKAQTALDDYSSSLKTDTTTTGSTYTPTPSVDANVSREDKQVDDYLNQMKSSLDSTTKGLIDNIQQKFEQRRIEQRDVNERTLKANTNALLMGGVTGQGSSAQYAPISSQGILAATESYGIKQIAALDAQEQDLIMQAKAAQQEGNYKILEKKLALAEAKRKEKIDAATKLNEEIAKQNKKLQEENEQATKDLLISDIYASGITDVPTILKNLNKQGVTMSAKTLTETLKNIVPPGLDELVKTLRTNGAPASVVSKVLSSANMAEAYENAGSYAAGGTGIIGEYNLYRAQALEAGQVPVDFSTYQDIDANRKRKASDVTPSGLPSNINTAIDKLSASFDSSPIVKQYNEVQNKKLTFDSLINSGVKGPADLALVFEFMKALDPTSVVRTEEYENAAKSGNIFAGTFARFNGYLKSGGGFLPETVKKDFATIVNKKFDVAATQYKNLKKETARKIENKTKPYGDTLSGEDYLTNYEGASTANTLISKAEEAKNKINDYVANNPNEADRIAALYEKPSPAFNNQIPTDEQIAEYLNLK